MTGPAFADDAHELDARLDALITLAEGNPRAALEEIESLKADHALDAVSRIHVLAAGSLATSRVGDNARALEDAQEALRLIEQSDLPEPHKLKALSLMAAARANDNMGNAAEALSSYYDSWSIYRDLGDNAGMAMAHTGGARIYNEIGQHDRALANYRIALGRAEKAGDLFLRVRILNNIAYTLIRLGNPIEALATLDKADALNRELGNELMSAYLTDNRGEALLEAGRFEEAEAYLEESLRLGRKLGMDALISGTQYDIARLKLQQGDLDTAKAQAMLSLELAHERRERPRERDTLALLSDINAALGDFETAFRELKESYAIRESIVDNATRQLAAVLEAQSTLERKEQEIALLQRDRRIDALRLDREREIRNLGTIGIVALLILLITLVSLLRSRIRATREAEARSRELLEAHRKLEEAHRAKSDFLAMTSHEVRTPLNGIMGMTQVLMRSGLKAEDSARVRTIHQSAELLLALLNDILDMSKIEAGRVDIREEPFDLPELLESIRNLWMPRAADRGLELLFDQPDDMPRQVVGDAVRVRQILNNLISNALKFTSQGRIRLALVREDDGMLRFSISDTGIGIEEADRDRIFAPFMQAQTGATREYGGSGLGLAICKNLVELMGGTIDYVSQPGKGTTFHFRLPLKEVAQSGDDDPPAECRLPAAQAQVVRERPLLLIAEDNEMNRIVIREMFHNQGYDLTFATNGVEAVEAVRRDLPDLVLMDIHMPVMGGMEAVAMIRTLGSGFTALPVIAITADAMDGDRRRILEAGMNDYISKPIDRLALLAMVARYLGRNPAEVAKGREAVMG
ncbi:MAG: hypothetical protein Kow00104_12740 [Rhodothalassiaceae bacterium]